MFWFRKKEKKRQYPSVLSEWLTEFRRMDTAFLSEQDADMLRTGCLKDSKYSIEPFKKEFTSFLEKQLAIFSREFGRAVQLHIEENDCDYLLLTIRRFTKKYERIFFFENFGFLPAPYRQEIIRQLKAKLHTYEEELVEYFDKLALYSASMSDVSLNVRRLMEVQIG